MPPPSQKLRDKPAPPSSIGEAFHRLAARAATVFGTAWAFAAAMLVVVVWAATGPLFHFSETWQLVINTGTTVITFLMVFLIQSTQNRDARAIHLKLDELIRCTLGARDVFADLEEATDEELEAFQHEFEQLRKRRGRRGTRKPDQQSQHRAPDKDRPA